MEQLNITLKISENIDIGSVISLTLLDPVSSQRVQINEEVVKLRAAPGQVSLGATNEATIQNFANSFNLDYSGITFVMANRADLRIGVLQPGLQLSDLIAYNPTTGVNLGDFYTDYTPISNFTIEEISFEPSLTNPCEKIRVKVRTSQSMMALCNNMQCVPVSGTIGEIECFRGVFLTISCTQLSNPSNTASQNIYTPSMMDTVTNPIHINISHNENGGFITINTLIPLGGIEYSLDGVNWQTQPSFSGLENGNYILQFRDAYGCIKSKPFSILDNNHAQPVLFISKENSFRFREPSGQYHTDENRPFCKSAAQLNYGYIQEFLNTDIITTQFRSNYLNIDVRVTDLDTGMAHPITVVQLTQNINNKAKYNQAKSYQITSNQFGIYFESGNILDYDTNLIIDSYNLNGSLPIWVRLGNIIKINGVGYYIDSISYDEGIGAEVIVLNGIAPTGNIEVSCIYNIHDYEVFEFTIDFSQFTNRRLRIEILNEDPNFGEHIWTSEEINTVENLIDYLEIRYWNSSNTNIIYSSGIKHLLRLPYNTIKANDFDNSENYSSDTNTYLLDSSVKEITDFEFMPFPLELFRKLKIALSLDNVFIDGVGYTKNAEFSKENLGVTNLYKLTAAMVKNGNTFSYSSNTNVDIVDNSTVNIPGLIAITNDGFLAQ